MIDQRLSIIEIILTTARLEGHPFSVNFAQKHDCEIKYRIK